MAEKRGIESPFRPVTKPIYAFTNLRFAGRPRWKSPMHVIIVGGGVGGGLARADAARARHRLPASTRRRRASASSGSASMSCRMPSPSWPSLGCCRASTRWRSARAS